MKRFLILLIAFICCVSCVKGEQTSNKICVEKFTYEQHEYLRFHTHTNVTVGVTHDPNCWCMIDYD